jgi:hypothetical protein
MIARFPEGGHDARLDRQVTRLVEIYKCYGNPGRLFKKARTKDEHQKQNSTNVLLFAPGRIALRCATCGGDGFLRPGGSRVLIPCDGPCGGNGWIGVIPELATDHPRGSLEKVTMMVARYRAGLPLWNALDRKEVNDFEERQLHRDEDTVEPIHGDLAA